MKRKISITLCDWEWELIRKAMEAREMASRGRSVKTFSPRARNRFIRNAAYIMADQVIFKSRPPGI